MTELITLQKILIENSDNSEGYQYGNFLAHCPLKRRISSQNNPESGKKVLFTYTEQGNRAWPTLCLVFCFSDLVSDALEISASVLVVLPVLGPKFPRLHVVLFSSCWELLLPVSPFSARGSSSIT